MKKIIIAGLLAIASTYVNAQKTITYLQYQNGAVEVKRDSVLPPTQVTLTFGQGVPDLTTKQVATLLKDEKLFVSERYLKGKYSVGVLYFTPKSEQLFVVLKNGKVSTLSVLNSSERQLSWWYIFGLTSMVLLFLALRLVKYKNLFVFAAAPVAFAAAVFAPATFAPVVFAFAATAAFFAAAFAATAKDNNKSIRENVPYVIYNLLMIIFFILCYFQV